MFGLWLPAAFVMQFAIFVMHFCCLNCLDCFTYVCSLLHCFAVCAALLADYWLLHWAVCFVCSLVLLFLLQSGMFCVDAALLTCCSFVRVLLSVLFWVVWLFVLLLFDSRLGRLLALLVFLVG